MTDRKEFDQNYFIRLLDKTLFLNFFLIIFQRIFSFLLALCILSGCEVGELRADQMNFFVKASFIKNLDWRRRPSWARQKNKNSKSIKSILARFKKNFKLLI
jgi:hypothetical protein